MPLSLRVSNDLHDRIDALARSSSRTPSDLARQALERALPELEWEQRLIEMARAYRQGDLRAVTADEIDQMLGIVGKPVDYSVLDEIE